MTRAVAPRRNIAIAVAVLVAIVAAVWLLRSRIDPVNEAARDAAGRATSDRPPEVAYPPAFPYDPTAAIAAAGKDQVELCGFGMVDGAQLPAGLEQEAEAAILRVVEQMERAKTDRERAIGVSVRASLAAQAAFAAATGGDMQKCSETPGCWDRANKAQQRAVAPSAENLARLAATTHDPQTYAAAFRACHAFRTDPAAAASCANLRAEQLAQLDPDNATSWFEVANEAANRKDDKAVESALLRAAQGKRVDSLLLPYLGLTKGIDIHYEPVRTLILMRLAGSYFAQPLPPYAVISTYCSKEMAGSPGRKDGCMALASLLAERGPDLLAVRLGAAIGERAGWPADRIAHYAEERKAIDAEMVRATPGVGSLDCDWSARLETWVAGVTNHGEAGYIRQLLAKRQAR